MNQPSSTISAIETFIRINGDRFKLYYHKHGMKGEMLPFRKIIQIEEEYGSIADYIEEFINTHAPEKIEVITKKPNGTSHGISPKVKIFELENNMKPSTNSNLVPTNANHLQPLFTPQGLQGVEKIHSLETTLLNRELQKETNRAERYEGLYQELREKHFELEKDYKLLKEKTALDREKERLEQENSLTSVIKEFKPEIAGLFGNLVQPNGNPNQPSLEGTTSEQITLLSETVLQLPKEMQTETIEVLIRYLNLDPQQRGKILSKLRTSTPSLDEQLNQILNNHD